MHVIQTRSPSSPVSLGEEIARRRREELLLERREAGAKRVGKRDRHSASIPRASVKSFGVSPPSE